MTASAPDGAGGGSGGVATMLPSVFGDDAFNRWFPSKVAAAKLAMPAMRVICFAGAGMEQLVFTSKGTPRNPQPNPLVEFGDQQNVQVLAVQLPGRSMRHREPAMRSIQEVVQNVFQVLKPLLLLPTAQDGGARTSQTAEQKRTDELQPHVPFVLVGHSMGCFCVYEFVRLLEKERKTGRHQHGLPQFPLHVFLSCCIPPHTPEHLRPWRRSADLSDEELKEEARQWDVNAEVFKPDLWNIYKVLFRADFPLYDTYVMTPPPEQDCLQAAAAQPSSSRDVATAAEVSENVMSNGAEPVSCKEQSDIKPLPVSATCWYAEFDKRITQQHMMDWKPHFSGSSSRPQAEGGDLEERRFSVNCVKGGNHSFLYDKDLRASWMHALVEELKTIVKRHLQ